MGAILLFGGNSDERLVSVASAQNLAQKYPFDELWFLHFEGAISRVEKKELIAHQRPFEVEFVPKAEPFAAGLEAALPHFKGNAVFIGMHGTQGEDGKIQSFFEKNKIAFTGSGSVSSQNCFDKVKAKKILRETGTPLATELTLSASERSTWPMRLRDFFAKNGAMVVKPVANGSSVGLYIVRSPEQLDVTVKELSQSKLGDYLIETFLAGRELTVGVMEKKDGSVKALPASEAIVLNEGSSFDYQGKYLGRGTKEVTPAELTDAEMKAAQALALAAHKALNCRGYTRTDMILTEKGPIYLETNTLPGMTKASFIPQQLEAAGIKVRDFLEEQLFIANKRKNS